MYLTLQNLIPNGKDFMKKFGFVLLIILTFILLASCGNYQELTEKDKLDTEWESKGTTEYIVNKATYSYHLSDCFFVKSIKEENKIITTDIDFLIEHQYSPCKKCIKNEQ